MKAHKSTDIAVLPLTLALDGGGLMPHPSHLTTIVQETGLAPGLVCMGIENLAPTGIQFLQGPASSELLYGKQ